MTASKLKNEIAIGHTDYEFMYKGKQGSICPFNMADNSFFATISYDGHCVEFHDLDKLMKAKILDGKSLSEVAAEIELYG